MRTPLVRLGLPEDRPRIFLKLENLQPIGSFKLRGAANAMAVAGRDRRSIDHG
jgi:threonine dehydratase